MRDAGRYRLDPAWRRRKAQPWIILGSVLSAKPRLTKRLTSEWQLLSEASPANGKDWKDLKECQTPKSR
jgi:hypothetical protein